MKKRIGLCLFGAVLCLLPLGCGASQDAATESQVKEQKLQPQPVRCAKHSLLNCANCEK